MARMDADGPDLPVLPVHRRRGDGALVRATPGTGRDAWRAGGEGGEAGRDPVRTGARAARVPALRLRDDPDPGRAPAHRARVPVRDTGRAVAAVARAGGAVRRVAAGLLGAHDVGAGAGRGPGR